MYRPYKECTENQIRNSNSMSIPKGYADAEILRQELRYRGLSDEGYHNT